MLHAYLRPKRAGTPCSNYVTHSITVITYATCNIHAASVMRFLLSERHLYLELRSVLPTTHKGWYVVSTYRHCEEATDEA
jgi:hypothetical protein